jgi:hypothetical protein
VLYATQARSYCDSEDKVIYVSGTAEANCTVEILGGSNYKGESKTHVFSGNWGMEILVGQTGTYSIKARAKDFAGNVSGRSNTRTVNVENSTLECG